MGVEGVSRRAVVRAGEVAVEMLAAQKKFSEQTSLVLDGLAERMQRHEDKTDERFDDLEHDLGTVATDLKEEFEDDIHDLQRDINDKAAVERVETLDEDITRVGDNLTEFQRMGFVARFRWLLTGELP